MAKKADRSFFDIYPHEYDALTNAAGREQAHRKEVAAIIKRFKPASVLDAGCATGLTVRLFAERGIATVGLDRSKVLVAMAKRKIASTNKLQSFVVGHFERIPRRLAGRFDLVVCLANSISGVGTIGNLRKAMRGFYGALRPGGNLVLQMLNYTLLKEGEILPVRATSNENIVYQRFSERRGRRLYLYVTRLDLAERPPKLEVFRHEMDNFTRPEIEGSFREAGFKHLKRFGDLLMSKNFTRDSRDLVICATRL